MPIDTGRASAVTACTLVGLCLLVGGCRHAASVEEEWKTIAPPEHGFSVLMPGEPHYEAGTLKSPAGPLPFETYEVIRDHVPDGFAVTYTPLPYRASPITDKAVLDGLARGVNKRSARLQEEKTISLGGVPGREIVLFRAGIAAPVMRARVYLAGKKIYQVMAVTTEADASSPKVAKFLDSFQILPK